MTMAVPTSGSTVLPEVHENARLTIAEDVRELGLRFRGADGSSLVFDRVFADENATSQDMERLADEIALFLRRSATENPSVAQFLVSSATEMLRIS